MSNQISNPQSTESLCCIFFSRFESCCYKMPFFPNLKLQRSKISRCRTEVYLMLSDCVLPLLTSGFTNALLRCSGHCSSANLLLAATGMAVAFATCQFVCAEVCRSVIFPEGYHEAGGLLTPDWLPSYLEWASLK